MGPPNFHGGRCSAGLQLEPPLMFNHFYFYLNWGKVKPGFTPYRRREVGVHITHCIDSGLYMFIGAGHPTEKQVVMVTSGDVSLYLPETLGHCSLPFRPCWMGPMELRPVVLPEFLGLAAPELRRPSESFWDLHETCGKMRLKPGKMVEV